MPFVSRLQDPQISGPRVLIFTTLAFLGLDNFELRVYNVYKVGKKVITMTLEKALEIILLNLHENEKIICSDAADSWRIAAEAIQLVITLRLTGNKLASHLLLHETK